MDDRKEERNRLCEENRRTRRLLYLVREKYPSFRPDVTELFGRELPAAGVKVVALMTNAKPCDQVEVRRMGRCVVVVTPSIESFSWPSWANKLSALLRRYMLFIALAQRARWEVVQSRDEILGAWLVVLATLRSKARRAYWLSFPFPEEKFDAALRERGWRRLLLQARGRIGEVLLYRSGLRLMDKVFVQSDQMRDDLFAYGLDIDRMTPVPMAVQLRGLPVAPRVKEPPHHLTIGYLGTLDAARRPEFMVDVLALVRNEVRDAKLLMVGEGARKSDRKLIEDYAKKLGLAEAVSITGFLPREQAWKVLSESFVCLSPFYPTKILNSTSPTKLIEYLQLGLPVVANDHPEQRLVIKSSGVGKCVPWNAQAFADAVLEMWREPHATWQFAANGPAYVRRHRSYEAVGASVVKEYAQLCEKE